MWPAIAQGEAVPLEKPLMFASEIPIYGSFKFTAFDESWKLVQEVEQEQLSVTVTNYLFDISKDPNEYNNLASAYPEVVEQLSEAIHEWRALYPINGTRSELVPPPGWRAPRDWARYPIPLEELQDESNTGMAPTPSILRVLDWQHGSRGRLEYNCSSRWWSGGVCIRE